MGDAIVIGSRLSAATLRVQAFLTRNSHPHRYIDIDSEPDVPALLDGFKVSVDDLPVLICRGEKVLRNPTNAEIADCLGFNRAIEPDAKHDLVIVGAGPTGLAAAVYAASEGLDVLVLEATAPGGQAGSSSKIENYLGFPLGISGQALAQRALSQAEKFGAKLSIASGAVRLHCDRLPYRVEVEGGSCFSARAIVNRNGRRISKAAIGGPRALRGGGRVLWRYVSRGAALRSRRSDRGGRRQLSRASRRVPGADFTSRAHLDPRPELGRQHVELPDTPHRREPEHHAPQRAAKSSSSTAPKASKAWFFATHPGRARGYPFSMCFR